MRNLNRLELTGYLTKDLDIKSIGNLIVTSGSIAVNEKHGEKEETLFINFKAFGKLAEVMGKFLLKGSRVYIEGSLKNNNYDKKDGAGKVYGYELLVKDFLLLDKKNKDDIEHEG